jgi:hypothetical protein
MFKAYRAKGAPIALAPDPKTGHECGDSRYLAIPFLDACLAARLPDKGAKEQKLKLLDSKKAYLAKPLSDEAVAAGEYKGKAEEAVYLIDQRVAKVWAEYVKTGAVSDSTPPPAPAQVKAKRTDAGVELTWDAEADFESGLRGFEIQRDGKTIAQLPEKPVGRFGRALFQVMSYHDTPERPLPAMRFIDKTAKADQKYEYRIVSVNGVGLKSKPSSAAVVEVK